MNVELKGMQVHPGDKLPNGATTIAVKRVSHGAVVILAMNPGDFQPYVTWIGCADGSATYAGHYFEPENFMDAAADFAARH